MLNKDILFTAGLFLTFLIWINFLPQYVFIILLLEVLLVYFAFFKRELYLIFILLCYLVVAGEISPVLRMIVHIIGFISLSLFLVKNLYSIKTIFNSIHPLFKKYLIYFFSLFFISSLFSSNPLKGFEIILKEIYFFYLIFGFYTYIYLSNRIKEMLFILMIAGIIMSLSSILSLKNFNVTEILLTGSAGFRTGGILSNVNALSGFIVVSFPFFITYFIITKKITSKVFLSIGIIVLLLGILSTISRSAGLSVIIGMLFYFYHFNKKIAAKILISIICLIALILSSPFAETLSSVLRIGQGFSQRDLLWQLSLNMFKDNWLLGVGPGLWGDFMFNYSPVLQDSFVGYLFYDVHTITEGFNNSHNYYLSFASEMGIPGLLLAIYLPYVFFKVAGLNLKNSNNLSKETYLINLSLISVGVSMFIRAIFEGISIVSFGWISVDLPFWIIVSIILYYNNYFKVYSK